MRLLVTGAAGMLGRDVALAAAAGGLADGLLALSRAELDVTDAAAVSAAVRDHAPDAIVNCAAWTDVDGAEADPAGATAVNGTGAGNVARAAAAGGAFVVQVSSDYVFDGTKAEGYAEDDPTGPLSAYGESKLAGEHEVATAGAPFAIARSSWLFGVGGRNFVDTMLRLAADRDEVAVVTDQVGNPTFTGHLAAALLAIAQDRREGIHHVAGGGRCSWNDLARATFERAGVDCRVAPATSEDMARPARRPAYSVLLATRADTPRLPAWEEGLDAYLAARAQPTEAAR